MQVHVVSPRETLFSIALYYEVSPGLLARSNGLTEPYRLVPGQSLLILRPTAAVTVRPGDSLYEIARRSGVNLRALLRMNPNLAAQAALYPGQTVVTALEDTPERSAELFGYAYPNVSSAVLAGILPYAGALMPFTYGLPADGALV